MIETLLGGLSPQQFLHDYWQKKPLFIPNAIPGFQSPIDADELAGLACEDDVETRIILERDGEYPWQCRHGPFTETDFAELPNTHWTLLVQECNKHDIALTELLDQFHFIPNWRVDDIMLSYAPQYGSVGPHIDQYDVFLLQASGKRRWQISTETNCEFIPDLDLKILKQFNPGNEWIAEPGDMLYLPPGIGHHGVACEDCITISVGFRAPSQQELVGSFVDHVIELISEQKTSLRETRYGDPDLRLQKNPGEISVDSIDLAMASINEILKQTMADEPLVHNWFATFVTQPKNSLPELAPEQPIQPTAISNYINRHGRVYRSEYSRFAYINTDNGTANLYVDGEVYQPGMAARDFILLLCKQRQYTAQELQHLLNDQASCELFATLFNQGKLYVEHDDE